MTPNEWLDAFADAVAAGEVPDEAEPVACAIYTLATETGDLVASDWKIARRVRRLTRDGFATVDRVRSWPGLRR